MNFLAKIENFINHLIYRLMELMIKYLGPLVPLKIRHQWKRCLHLFEVLQAHLKALPKKTLPFLLGQIPRVKKLAQSLDIRSKLSETYKTAREQYELNRPKSASKLKKFLMAPFLLIGQWLQGLSTGQATLLMAFSAASFLAGVNIIFSGQRIAGQYSPSERAPASIEEELSYDRPAYYKKQERHLEITSLRLPVYIPDINEVKSVDIDFIMTTSNRFTKNFLSKYEFQLRDHLILNMEPLIATFPLEEEGKEVLRHKLILEIDEFLKIHNIEGHLKDIKLTYILAN